MEKNIFMSKIDNSQIDRQKYHEDLVKYADKAFENYIFLKILFNLNKFM